MEHDLNRLILLMEADDYLNINIIGQVAQQLMQPLPNEGRVEPRGQRTRNENFFEVTIPQYTNDLFKEHFRMSRRAFQELLNILGPRIDHTNDKINFEKKVLFTVWVLAKPESFLAAGDRFNIAKSTSHGIFTSIVTCLAELVPDYIIFPNQNQYAVSSNVFQNRSHGFPGVVGSVDGCHITIKQPVGNEHDFYSRKGVHSINLQGVCNHAGKLIDIFVGMPGRMHDARVFRNSPLFEKLTDLENPLLPLNYHLIGDSAYPLLVNLMCPFRDTGHLTAQEIRYNTKLSSIRSIIERVFGVLKNKWRRLYFLNINSPELGNKIIAAACVLHNFLIERNELNMQEELENIEIVENVDILYPRDELGGQLAIQKRNIIANRL